MKSYATEFKCDENAITNKSNTQRVLGVEASVWKPRTTYTRRKIHVSLNPNTH
ncbi:hypothetical protein Syun_027214 [Stephania yunnanensis]|uniref:Uncharacterized protein n=1 Tax=Stephania yunnanensis TaxID=152371 RepID=A0AAP0EMJ2_9MAGN